MKLRAFPGRAFWILMVTPILLSCQKESREVVSGVIGWTEAERSLLIDGLQASRDTFLAEIEILDDRRWVHKIDPIQWSAAEILEHLILQEQAYVREFKVVVVAPPDNSMKLLSENDAVFIQYATDSVRSQADWDVYPTGRFCTKSDAVMVFDDLRAHLIKAISSTDADLRRHFTYRQIPDALVAGNPDFYKVRKVRDLHQLILNDIAHTRRHINQLQRLKKNMEFPVLLED